MPEISPKRRREAKQQIRTWVDMSWPRWRIDCGCWDLYELETEIVSELLEEIRHEQKDSMNIDRQTFLAQQLTRLEALATRAQEEGNLSVALNAYREIHALAGLHIQR